MNYLYTESKKPIFSFVLVIIQFFCIFYILLTANFYPESTLFVVYLLGVLLGLWSIFVMRKAKLNITPDVVPGTRVVTDGPYRVIRHPMYLAIFLTLLPLVIESFSISRLIVYLALIVNQVIKIEYEEKKLTKELEYYRDYKMLSWKLLPFIY